MNSIIRIVPAALLLLTGCQTTKAPPEAQLWVRTDGQKAANNPALQQQGEVDRQICVGEAQKAAVGQSPIYYQGLGGAIAASQIEADRKVGLEDIMKGCMASRGYILVPESQAEARRQMFEASAKSRPRPKP